MTTLSATHLSKFRFVGDVGMSDIIVCILLMYNLFTSSLTR